MNNFRLTPTSSSTPVSVPLVELIHQLAVLVEQYAEDTAAEVHDHEPTPFEVDAMSDVLLEKLMLFLSQRKPNPRQLTPRYTAPEFGLKYEETK